jgi:hypothetical protein
LALDAGGGAGMADRRHEGDCACGRSRPDRRRTGLTVRRLSSLRAVVRALELLRPAV